MRARDAKAHLYELLDERPILLAIAGPNGAGKSTFFEAHLASAGLRFVNADVIARDLQVDAYEAATLADAMRRAMVQQRESFIFETVFSDPAGDKLRFLKQAEDAGYTVALCFIGLSGPLRSDERVAMRVSQGGHDVPLGKLRARYPRTMANLAAALEQIPHVLVFDNDDLSDPYRLVEVTDHGTSLWRAAVRPPWLRAAWGGGKHR